MKQLLTQDKNLAFDLAENMVEQLNEARLLFGQFESLFHAIADDTASFDDSNFRASGLAYAGRTLSKLQSEIFGSHFDRAERDVFRIAKQKDSDEVVGSMHNQMLEVYGDLTKLILAQDGLRHTGQALIEKMQDIDGGRSGFAVISMANLVQNLTNGIAAKLHAISSEIEVLKGMDPPDIL